VDSRVVHVTAHYPPYLGGLEKVVESIAADRMAQGLAVRVLTSLDGQSKVREPDDAEFVQRLRSWEIAHTAIIPGLPGQLLRLSRDSIIHLHIAQAFVPEAVYLAHLLRGLSYVAQLHIDAGPSGRAGFLLSAYKPLVLGPVLRAAATVVVFTEEQRSIVSSKYSVDLSRIAVIPNGVDDSLFYSGPRYLHERPRLLFVGRLSTQKNLLLFLRSLGGVSERFDTLLVGEGELEAELKAAVRDLRLNNVHFYGRAHGAELRELYRNADVLVLPSEREGMPLVLLEAMAMGLPVVATDIPGNRDVVVNGESGFLVPLREPSAMREALLAVASSQDRYRCMCDAARRLAERYSWRTVCTKFEEVYAQAGEH
jgi:glycosyltransferase involved in cell wall biosynthesis